MLTEDPAGFLADWGEPVTIDGIDAGLCLHGAPYMESSLGGPGMASAVPQALIPDTALPAPAPDATSDAVLVLTDRQAASTTPFRFFIRTRQPDGTGWTLLVLAEHPDQS